MAFVHNRWMTYEGGDFTWEDEYLVPPDAGEFVLEETVAEPASPGLQPDFLGAGLDASPHSSRPRVASDTWPYTHEMAASDPFNNLHRISAPMLLMHGEKDDICPLSQSQVAFHMLEKQGIPTGLIIYPDEGHGFDKPEHQRDRDRRMLAWWREHLPDPGPTADINGCFEGSDPPNAGKTGENAV